MRGRSTQNGHGFGSTLLPICYFRVCHHHILTILAASGMAEAHAEIDYAAGKGPR
jgi:hypothetical protein